MSKSRNAGKENGDRGNGFHPEATAEMLDEEFDIESEAEMEPAVIEPLSHNELCEEVRCALGDARAGTFKVTYETDRKGRSGVVIWNINRAAELKITTALAERMTFQVGSYVEREDDGSDGKELGMVIFVFSIKGHGRVR
jgi:hypothetical protein